MIEEDEKAMLKEEVKAMVGAEKGQVYMYKLDRVFEVKPIVING